MNGNLIPCLCRPIYLNVWAHPCLSQGDPVSDWLCFHLPAFPCPGFLKPCLILHSMYSNLQCRPQPPAWPPLDIHLLDSQFFFHCVFKSSLLVFKNRGRKAKIKSHYQKPFPLFYNLQGFIGCLYSLWRVHYLHKYSSLSLILLLCGYFNFDLL